MEETEEDPFEAHRRKVRLAAIAIFVVVALAGAGAKAFYMQRDPLRVLSKHRTELEAQRDQFCRVLAAEKARHDQAVPVVKGDAATVSFGDPHDKPVDHGPAPLPSNADAIEMPQLEELCEHRRQSNGTLVDPLLPELLDETAAEGYDRLGYEAAIALALRSRYLVVLDVPVFTTNVSTGEKTMDAGEFAAHAALYSLSDGTCLGAVEASGQGPPMAWVDVTEGAWSKDGQVAAGLAGESKKWALRALERSFERGGRHVELAHKYY